MSKPVELSNGKSWATQKGALTHFKEMLKRHSNEEKVENYHDHEDLVSLIERYDEVIDDGPLKAGVGIDYFFRRRNSGNAWSSDSFWIRRVDGTETDFSYISAVKGVGKEPSKEFYDACRNSVGPELAEAKRRFFSSHPEKDTNVDIKCELSGEQLCLENAHIDHAYPPFNQIVHAFRAAKGWSQQIPAGLLSTSADCQFSAEFIDLQIRDEFRTFHRNIAVLRVIHKKANLAMAGRQRKPKVKFPITLQTGQ